VNIVDDNIDLTQEYVSVNAQGYLLGEERISGPDTYEHLVAYVGFESKSSDKTQKNFYYPINLGRINSTDKDQLFRPTSSISGSDSRMTLTSVSAIEETLRENVGRNLLFSLNVYNEPELGELAQPDKPTDLRSRSESLKQNALSKALIAWMERTVSSPEDVPLVVEFGVVRAPAVADDTGQLVATGASSIFSSRLSAAARIGNSR
jgi:hypothetical protein